MSHKSDGFGNYVITQNQSLRFPIITTAIMVVLLISPFVLNLLLDRSIQMPYYFYLLFAVYFLLLLISLRKVPYKHYGIKTFGRPVDSHKLDDGGRFVYEQGLHFIEPWFGMRIESIEPILISYQLDNVQTINNIVFSIKGSVLYRMGNAAKFSEHKTEAEKRIRAGVENGISNLIKDKSVTDRELTSLNEEIKDFIFKEIDHLKEECGFYILKQSIEWNKPLNSKVIDNYAEEAKFSSQIKRIATLAKELNISAEEAFRIEGIRTGLINSNDNVFKITGAKEIIEAAMVFMKK